MKLTIKATKIELTAAIQKYIEDKFGSLEKFVSRWDSEGAVEIRVEVGRTTAHHHKGDIFRAEVNLGLPGKMLRAEDTNKDLRTAIGRVRNKVQREIRKVKDATSPR